MVEINVVTPGVFTALELQKYERTILDNPHITEREASEFFWQFPRFLTFGEYKKIAKEVILYKPNGEFYRVDFCRCRFGTNLWDFVELKDPRVPFIVKHGSHYKYSSTIQSGIDQAVDYRDLLEETMTRLELEKRANIKAYKPSILLIGGRSENTIIKEDLLRLLDRYHRIDIKTYDDLYEFAKDVYESSCYFIPTYQTADLYLSYSEEKVCRDNYGGTRIVSTEELEKELEAEYDRYTARWEERGPRAGPHPSAWLANRIEELKRERLR